MMVHASHDVAVRCSGVTKTYGTGDARVMALRGVDLEVRRGELLMLVGPSVREDQLTLRHHGDSGPRTLATARYSDATCSI